MRANTKTEKAKREKVLAPIRVTVKEEKDFKKKAKSAGLSLSEFQRQALNDAVIIVRDNALDLEAVRELSAIGHNLNQLVRKTHIHDETDTQKMRDILINLDIIIMGIVSDSQD